MAVLMAIVAIGVYAPTGQPPLVATINQAVATYLQEHPLGAVSVIIETNGDPAPLMQLVQQSGGRVDSRMSVLNGFTASINPALADRLNHDSRVKLININAPIKWLGAVDSSQLQTRYNGLSRVPSAWNAGLDGSEVQVAVVDSGVWPHDDLTQKSVSVPGNKGNRLLSAYTNPLGGNALDQVGHGTHVAGIIGGNGYDSGGQYIGVAPNSLIVSVKVADASGGANEGDVITGLEWVYQSNKNHGMHIRIVNLSLQSTVAQSYNQSALDAMVEKLWASGVVVVAASGNNPNGANGAVLYAPGNDPFIITVGSIDDNYQSTLAGSQMAAWALFGSTQDGFAKPDVVADGSHVVSLLAPGSSLSAQHTGNIVGTNYFKMGGTSMAAPQVAGMAALMLQNNPSLTNRQVKKRLMSHSVPFSTTAYTSVLGTMGGYLDESAVGAIDADTPDATAPSQSYDPVANTVQAGGVWWVDANWVGTAWDNTSWTNTSWTSADFAAAQWTVTCVGCLPALVSTVWSNTSWTNTSWTNTSWTNTSWTSIAWNNTSWTNTSWTNTSWTNTSWTNTSWTNTSWTNTSWTNTSWTSTWG